MASPEHLVLHGQDVVDPVTPSEQQIAERYFDPEAMQQDFILQSVGNVIGKLGAEPVGWDVRQVLAYKHNGREAVSHKQSPSWVGYAIEATYSTDSGLEQATVFVPETDMQQLFAQTTFLALRKRALGHRFGKHVDQDKARGTIEVIFPSSANASFDGWANRTRRETRRAARS